MATTHPFDAFVEHAAQIFAAALTATVPTSGRLTNSAKTAGKVGRPASVKARTTAKRKRGPSAAKGKKLDMNCRIAGCKNRSGGPRNGFMCPEHQKLPQKEQQAARDAYKAKSKG